ncbi:MAG: hypothetical protein ABR577_05825 [Pyrinomonadaceae bacterium]
MEKRKNSAALEHRKRGCLDSSKRPLFLFVMQVGAEGGTRTRTALRPTDFLTTMAFATCNAVCGLGDAFSVHYK